VTGDELNQNLSLLITHHSPFITVEKIARAGGVALETGADESGGKVFLKLRAHA
jgi:hypothetical protein